jgi:DNA-binding response OmpR family regulator
VKGTVICPMCRLAQPVDDADAEAEAEVSCGNCGHPLRSSPKPPRDSRPVTILWIDDDRLLLTFGRDILERHGYRVRTALDGPTGIAAVKDDPPDLIILDVVMPDMTGYEVCRRLRAEPGLQDTPVLLLTSLQDPQVDVLGRGIGETFTMSKPSDPEMIVSIIAQVLGQSNPSVAS